MRQKWFGMMFGMMILFASNLALAVIQEAENQPVASTGVGQRAYVNASGGNVLEAWGEGGWIAALKPGLTGRYTINVRTRAGYTGGNYFGTYNLSVDGQSLAMVRDDSTKVWSNDNENYVWWKMTDVNGVVLTANSIGQVAGDWVWGFVDAYEFVPVTAVTSVTQEAENQPVASSGVGQRAYANASGGNVLEAYGVDGWIAALKPGLTGRYVINVRTRAGYTGGNYFGVYNLSVDGQNLAMTRDDSTKVWSNDNENYVWWKMTDINGVVLTADSVGQVTGDWVWGFVDAYEFVPVTALVPVTQEAESQPVPPSGAGQNSSANASGGYVIQGWGDPNWIAALKPGLAGRYKINVRTRAGYTGGNYYGTYNLSMDGQSLGMARDDSTKVWHNDDNNFVWWKMTDPNGVVLTAQSLGQVVADWGWGFVDAYEFIPVTTISSIIQEAETQSVPSTGCGEWWYEHASAEFVLQGFGESGWIAALKPGLTGRYVINVRTRAGWAPNQSCYGEYALSMDGQSLAMVRDESTKVWYDDNENFVWWKMTDTSGVELTGESVGQVVGNWGWGCVDAYEFIPAALVPKITKTPTFSPAGGFISEPKSITITCDTTGAIIRYTTNGSDPTESSAEYTAPILVSNGTTLKAKAWAADHEPSAIKSVTYTIPATYRNPETISYSDAVTVDGNISVDWANATWTSLNEVYHIEGGTVEMLNQDIPEASYAVRWGDSGNKIYVAVKVRDTAHRFTDTCGDWNGRDAVEFYIHTTSLGATNYYPAEDTAQQYVVGIKNIDQTQVWASLADLNILPESAGFQAAGKVVGEWIYYEVAMTPFEYFGGLTQPNIISTLSAGDVIGLDVCVVGNNGVQYTGMKSENMMTGKSTDWNKIGLHKLAAAVQQIPGDANGDSMVDVGDLGILAANYGGSGKTWAQGDFNNDGLVDVGDLGILAANYGTGVNGAVDFDADYAKAFGTSVEDDSDDESIGGSVCSALGLPLLAGLFLAGLMLMKQED